MDKTSERASYAHVNIIVPVKADALDPTERPCSICLQPSGPTALTEGGSEAPVQLPCGHVFGEACIVSWTLTNNSCPLCRKAVFDFGIGCCSVNPDFSGSQVSAHLSSDPTPQDDIWLDGYVWNSSTDRQQSTVSDADADALLGSYPLEYSYSSLHPSPYSSLEPSLCGDHCGFCQCNGNGYPIYATVPHRRLTPPATPQIGQMDIENLDLIGLGSQFAELSFRYELWMDEYFNEPDFGEFSLFNGKAERSSTIDTTLSETVR